MVNIKAEERKTLNETTRKVVKVLAALLELPPETIREDDPLFEGLGLDSTRMIDLLLELEKACEIEFDMVQLQPEDLETVKSLANYIEQQKTASEA